tara:strand:+ start:56 stop:331 length:276 start_codon:yes stop_codon:yes gene_type:complete
MSNKLVTRLRNKTSVSQNDEDAAKEEAANEIERLEAQLARFHRALECIRDQTFEQANSTRLTDQLWYFVRWAKSIAREALESQDKEPHPKK